MHFPNCSYLPEAFSNIYNPYYLQHSQIMTNYHCHPDVIGNSYNIISSTLPPRPFLPNSEFPFYPFFAPHPSNTYQIPYHSAINEPPFQRSQNYHIGKKENNRQNDVEEKRVRQMVVKQENEQSEEVNGVMLRPRKESNKRHRRRSRRINASYYWSVDQNKRYCEFLEKNFQLFELTLSEKKNLRVNVLMSKKVKTRTPQQCHSHHQKMIKKFGTIQKLLSEMVSSENARKTPQKNNLEVNNEDSKQSEFQL